MIGHKKQLFNLLFAATITCALTNPNIPSCRAETLKVHSENQAYAVQINLSRPALQLYEDRHLVKTYAVALGKPSTQTPIGKWQIISKQKGWGGGFGSRWLGLNVPWGTYGIHGTNRPSSIGKYVSNGCIRMHNSDVEELYEILPIGTPVLITGNPLRHLRRLEYGNAGADVQLVQQKLKKLGFFQGTCDGRFGPATQFALTNFQLANRLPMTGSIGTDEYRALGLIDGK